MKPEHDPSWHNYFSAVIDFGIGQIAVNECAPLAEELVQILGHYKLLPAFGVITACNPHGQIADSHFNGALSERLNQRLGQLCNSVIPCFAGAADGSHREASFAVVLPLRSLTDLAIEFRQSAVFWFEEDRFWLVPAAVQAQPVDLSSRM